MKAGTVLLFIFISGCTLTTTKTKNPEFINIILVEKKLDSLISCENYNINGTETTTNKKSTSEIEISTINCRHIPKNDDQMVDLAKTIAIEIKNNLTDATQYDIYKVLFIIKKTSGVVTKTNSKTYVFNSKDL